MIAICVGVAESAGFSHDRTEMGVVSREGRRRFSMQGTTL